MPARIAHRKCARFFPFDIHHLKTFTDATNIIRIIQQVQPEMVTEMVQEDLALAKRDNLCSRHGFRILQNHE